MMLRSEFSQVNFKACTLNHTISLPGKIKDDSFHTFNHWWHSEPEPILLLECDFILFFECGYFEQEHNKRNINCPFSLVKLLSFLKLSFLIYKWNYGNHRAFLKIQSLLLKGFSSTLNAFFVKNKVPKNTLVYYSFHYIFTIDVYQLYIYMYIHIIALILAEILLS